MYRIVQLSGKYEGFSQFYVALIIGAVLSIAVFTLLVNPLHNFVKYTLINKFGDRTAVKDGFRSIKPKYNVHFVGLLMTILLNMGFSAPSYFDTKDFKRPRLQAFIVSISGVFSYLFCFGVFYFIYSTLKINNVYDIASPTFLADNNNTGGYIYYAFYSMIYYLAITCVYSALLNLIPVFPLDMGDALYDWLPLNWQDALRNNELFLSLGIFVVSFVFLGKSGGLIPNFATTIMNSVYSIFSSLYGA